jgi:hypothetical protein
MREPAVLISLSIRSFVHDFRLTLCIFGTGNPCVRYFQQYSFILRGGLLCQPTALRRELAKFFGIIIH